MPHQPLLQHTDMRPYSVDVYLNVTGGEAAGTLGTALIVVYVQILCCAVCVLAMITCSPALVTIASF